MKRIAFDRIILASVFNAVGLTMLIAGFSAATNAPTAHDVVLLQSEQDWNDTAHGYPATVFSCTRSAGAPPCAVGANTAQAVSDLLNAGYKCDSQLGTALLGYGVACVR